MTISGRSGLFAALGCGDTGAIIGTAESEWLEFKNQPYRLKEDFQKQELVKDVTALANSGGGVIVIGYETSRDQSKAQDTARNYCPVPRNMIDPKQYADIVESLSYPPIRNLTFRWWPESADPGVMTIEVESASEADRPILVVRAGEESNNRRLLVGIFWRSGDRVSSLTAAEIHTHIRVGRAIGETGPSGTKPLVLGVPEDERLLRLEADARDVGLWGHRRYFLQAWPSSEVEVQEIHAADGFRRLLPHPPEIREGGFNLDTRASPSVIPGGGLRVLDEGQISLSLQRNGLLSWVVTADSEFLAWEDERIAQRHSINPIAVVESTLEFVRLFVFEVLPRCKPNPDRYHIAGGMADVFEDNEASSLIPGRARSPLRIASRFAAQKAPSSDISIGPLQFGDEPCGLVAFRILRELYAQFGIHESSIPYAQDGEISEDLIRNST